MGDIDGSRTADVPTATSDAGRDAIGSETYVRPEPLHLLESLALVRERFGLDGIIADADILADLSRIAAAATPHDRWAAAYGSQLGHWLSLTARDVNASLAALMALLPAPRS